MSIKEYLKGIFLRREKNIKLLAEQKTQKVKEEMKEKQKEKEEGAVIKATAKIAYEQYQQGLKKIPENRQEEFIKEFTRLLMEEPEIPQDVIPEYIVEASREDTVGNIVPAIEELPDEQVKEIIFRENSSFSLGDKKQIVKKGISDTTLKDRTLKQLKKEEQERHHKELKRELRTKYVTCDRVIGQRLIDDLKEIHKQTQEPEIENMILQILARRAAIDCKLQGNTRIEAMTTIVSAENMLSGEFLKLVEEEFESVKDNKDYKGNRTDFDEVKKTLISQISSQIEKEEQL